jgi:hypothetical protein
MLPPVFNGSSSEAAASPSNVSEAEQALAVERAFDSRPNEGRVPQRFAHALTQGAPPLGETQL